MERANAVGGADGPLAPGTGWGPIAATVRYVEHFAANGHGADFGAAYFTGPGEWSTPSPFQMGHPGLFINVFYDRRINHWRSGCIATVDCNATGFSQSMGYWECKMRVPNGQGVFPAFWIKSTNDIPAGRQVNSSEIDIVEAYGTQPGSSYNWMTKLQ